MHGMMAYFTRRLLLVPLTFLCITFLVYAILRVVPGGPVEQAKKQARTRAMSGESSGGLAKDLGEKQLTKKQVEAIEEYYNLDRSIPVGYLIWLGVWPDRYGRFSGIAQGNLGRSTVEGRPVIEVIVSKFYISIYFGLIGYFSTWLVCIPLGAAKAIRHRSWFDTGTSVAVFFGYSIPGWASCLILLVLFGGGSYWDLVPLGGFRPAAEVWEGLSAWGRVKSQVHHTLVPVFGYIVGGFATMTVLMKNSLLENLGQDYVRTAFAKGLSERRVIFVHAMRNSLIPITAGIGHAIGLIFAGSFFIERVCNIPGMGRLGLDAVLGRDYPIVMGILVFNVLILLLGNIISDLVWAGIDPRIRFEK